MSRVMGVQAKHKLLGGWSKSLHQIFVETIHKLGGVTTVFGYVGRYIVTIPTYLPKVRGMELNGDGGW